MAMPIEKREVVWVTEYKTVYVNKNAVTIDKDSFEAQYTQADSPQPTTTTTAISSATTDATTITTQPTTDATIVEPSTISVGTSPSTSTSTPSSTSSSSSDSDFPNVGEMTYYDTGLGACGWTSTDSDFIVALSQRVFDTKTPNGNPNNNPYCGKKIEAKKGDKTVIVTVVDSCPGCAANDLDFSPTAFEAIADKDLGRTEFSWRWIDQV